MDNILIIWKGSDRQLEKFLTELIIVHPGIKFTVEHFLDLKLTKNNGTLRFTVSFYTRIP